jgi:CPA1 family monovalent cation:H+ antiporter
VLGASSGGGFPTVGVFVWLLVLKAGGGVTLGIGLGYLTYRLLCVVNSYPVEVMLTLALAMGGYALADALQVSAPRGRRSRAAGQRTGANAAMSKETLEHVERFWELIDDLLNVVLFLLLGLEILVVPFTKIYFVVVVFQSSFRGLC